MTELTCIACYTDMLMLLGVEWKYARQAPAATQTLITSSHLITGTPHVLAVQFLILHPCTDISHMLNVDL